MKKIAVISDIHGHLFLFNKILENAKQRDVNKHMFLGDYISDGPNADKIISKIKQLSNDVVYGNREFDINNYDGISWQNNPRYRNKLYAYNDLSDDNKKYLKTLPIYKIIKVEGKKICLSHGTPYQVDGKALIDSYFLFDKLINDFDCDIYLFGHQHRPFFTKYENRLFINVGSVNTPLDGKATSKYGLLTIDDEVKYELVEYNYQFKEVKNYYVESDYFNECLAWANLLIYALRDGVDYRRLFIKFSHEYAKQNNLDPKRDISEEVWHGLFFDFMQKNNLKVIVDKDIS